MQKLRDLNVLVALVVAALIVGIGIVGFDLPEGGFRREGLLIGAIAAGALTLYALRKRD